MSSGLTLGITKIGDLLLKDRITDIGNNKSIERIKD